ncbi:MAG: hypothetical protein ACRDCT_21685, partial [Shewanella sp.]
MLTYLSIHRPDLRVENLLHFAANIAKVSVGDFLVKINRVGVGNVRQSTFSLKQKRLTQEDPLENVSFG